jgi:hypothetical protein
MGDSVRSASVLSAMANSGRKNSARYKAGSGGTG